MDGHFNIFSYVNIYWWNTPLCIRTNLIISKGPCFSRESLVLDHPLQSWIFKSFLYNISKGINQINLEVIQRQALKGEWSYGFNSNHIQYTEVYIYSGVVSILQHVAGCEIDCTQTVKLKGVCKDRSRWCSISFPHSYGKWVYLCVCLHSMENTAI